MIGAHTSISVELWESDWNCRCWCRLCVCARCAWFKAVCARQREDESFFLSMWITYRLSIYVDSILESVAWFIRFQFTHKSCCCVYCLTFFKCYFAFWVSVFFTQPINWYTIWLRNKFAWKRQKHTLWTTTRSRRRREKKSNDKKWCQNMNYSHLCFSCLWFIYSVSFWSNSIDEVEISECDWLIAQCTQVIW